VFFYDPGEEANISMCTEEVQGELKYVQSKVTCWNTPALLQLVLRDQASPKNITGFLYAAAHQSSNSWKSRRRVLQMRWIFPPAKKYSKDLMPIPLSPCQVRRARS
jgi:hypothetical protein